MDPSFFWKHKHLLDKVCSIEWAFFRRFASENFDTNHFKADFVVFSSISISDNKVQVGKDQEKAQSEKDSHSKNRGGKKPN